MTTIKDALSRVRSIRILDGEISHETLSPVFRTAAQELARETGAQVAGGVIRGEARLEPGTFYLSPWKELDGSDATPLGGEELPGNGGSSSNPRTGGGGILLRLAPDGSGYLSSSHPNLLFGFLTHLLRELVGQDVAPLTAGKVFRPAFRWNRPTFDFFLTQEGRIQKGLDRESYVRRLAESGFTHVEVNGLAFPRALETGPPGEAYPMFYTYCPALDQFVESDLGAGLYPKEYLEANLAFLRENAELARKYGLVPGLLSFEPRHVPEAFFQRYPMLRGARVDHPFRSFKPRYNMTIAHPLVREHYAQMLRRLMEVVPELGYFSIWTNDSGAGFEHTQSLYVGRNGGAYLIREWKSQEEIARVAGENALRFLRVLRDAGREVSPGFRVLTRMESFYGEHDVVWGGLEDGLEVETASLAARGWEMPYTHPRYPDSSSFPAGSVYQGSLAPEEARLARELEDRSSHAHFYFAAGPWAIFSPLVGVPYPSLTHARLKLLHEHGVEHLAHMGGTHPPHLVPFNVNHEVLRSFQFDPQGELEAVLRRMAMRWTRGKTTDQGVGPRAPARPGTVDSDSREESTGAPGSDAGHHLPDALLKAWSLAEEAILAFPHVTPLYSIYGFVWYRLWARPLVPNIEAIPLRERAYYQDHMCTTPHNPNNVDLSRDVLFQLTTVADARKALERTDANVWEPLDAAIGILGEAEEEAQAALGEENVIRDQWVRLSALRCWLTTQRNVAAWVVGVPGFMEAESEEEREGCRRVLAEAVESELANSRRLMALLETGVEFMATTDQAETPLIHGGNLEELLEKRMALMEAHRNDEPYIDPEYMERKAGQPA